MENQPYTTIYIPSKQSDALGLTGMPPVGIECPSCKKGFIETGKWDSVICRDCKMAYKKSKFDKETTPEKDIMSDRVSALEEKVENLVKVVKVLRGDKEN